MDAKTEYKAANDAPVAGTAGEVKGLVTEMKTLFEQFKERDTQREAEIKKLGDATAETKAAQEKLNKALDEAEIKAQRSRVAAGLGKIDDEIKSTEKSVEVKAFEKYVRKGDGRLSAEELKQLASDSDTEGGVFVPAQLANRVIQKLILVSPFRSVATVEPISSNALEIPAEGATSFDAGWVGERTARTETTAASTRLERIPAHEMYAEPKVSQTQLDDSAFDIESWMSGRVATRFAQLEGVGFISGSGVQKPEGILSAGAGLASDTTGTSSVLKTDDMIVTWSTLPTAYAQNASWLLNRKTLGAIRKLKDTNGQYLWQPGGFGGPAFASGFPATILGAPYVEMPDMPDIASAALPVAFGDWRAAYQIVDRLGMRTLRDPFTSKPFVLFYTTKRVGGQTVLAEAARTITIA